MIFHEKATGGQNRHGFNVVDHVTSNFRTLMPAILWMEQVMGLERFWKIEFHTDDPKHKAMLIDTPKNRHHPNGHVYQRPGLAAYLPANGGLLAAVALMATGWTGGPTDAPGFPKDGKWNVRSEGLTPWM